MRFVFVIELYAIISVDIVCLKFQRAIDSGGKIDKSYHAVDVASILKLYLRTLPDPLINNDMQEILLRCLLLPESDRRCAIQFALLLLPVSYLHILHYVMEVIIG